MRQITSVILGLVLLVVVITMTLQSSAALRTNTGTDGIQINYQPVVDSKTTLKLRVSPPKPTHVTIDPNHYAGYIVLKFQEGTQVRLRDNQLVSLTGVDLATVEAVLASYPGVQPAKLFHRPESVLEQERLQGQAHSG